MDRERDQRAARQLKDKRRLESELEERTDAERLDFPELHVETSQFEVQLKRVEELFEEVKFESAPAGLAERIMERVRQVMRQEMAHLPSPVHESVIQAYTLVLLSTLPLLISASWAVSKSEQAAPETKSKITTQMAEILQSMTSYLREMQPSIEMINEGSTSENANRLVEMSLDLIPLTVMRILGEAIQELQTELYRNQSIQKVELICPD